MLLKRLLSLKKMKENKNIPKNLSPQKTPLNKQVQSNKMLSKEYLHKMSSKSKPKRGMKPHQGPNITKVPLHTSKHFYISF